MDISNIKAKIKLPVDKFGKPKECFELVNTGGRGWGGSSVKRVAWSTIIADPVTAIKINPVLAKKTNATPEQVEFIQQTSLKELQKIINDGKNTASKGGSSGKAVHSDKKKGK